MNSCEDSGSSRELVGTTAWSPHRHWPLDLEVENEAVSWEVIEADCVEAMVGMDEASVDAIVTDPPYGLEFMGKAWDRVPQEWHVAWAHGALRVLKPGGHLLAFGGTRTHHRLVCAVEDAGFEIRDSLMWLYGSGFPKSHNLKGDWEGWGTALKPAHEPIVVARKPLIGTVAANVLEHGTGALNVDGCRIGTERKPKPTVSTGRWPANVVLSHAEGCVCVGERRVRSVGTGAGAESNASGIKHGTGSGATYLGRKASAAHYGEDGMEAVEAWECAPGCPVAELDAQSGERVSGTAVGGFHRRSNKTANCYGHFVGERTEGDVTYGDAGGASRFFYCAKASRKERGVTNKHPTVKPIALMCWLVRLVTPPGGTVLDPFAGSGTTGIATLREGFNFIGIEREPEYAEIARARIADDAPLLNAA
jgi:hypothetical protein